jgi:hypothetical protein
MRLFRCNCEVPNANKTNEDRSVRTGQGELANRRLAPNLGSWVVNRRLCSLKAPPNLRTWARCCALGLSTSPIVRADLSLVFRSGQVILDRFGRHAIAIPQRISSLARRRPGFEFSAFLKRYIARWAGEAGALYLVNLVTRDSTISVR